MYKCLVYIMSIIIKYINSYEGLYELKLSWFIKLYTQEIYQSGTIYLIMILQILHSPLLRTSFT